MYNIQMRWKLKNTGKPEVFYHHSEISIQSSSHGVNLRFTWAQSMLPSTADVTLRFGIAVTKVQNENFTG